MDYKGEDIMSLPTKLIDWDSAKHTIKFETGITNKKVVIRRILNEEAIEIINQLKAENRELKKVILDIKRTCDFFHIKEFKKV